MEAGGGNDYDGRLAELLERGDEAGVGAAAAAAGWFPFFRSRTISTAAIFILWATSSILLGTVPDISISVAHMLLCFSFLIAGITLLTLSVVAAPIPGRASGEGGGDPRLESSLMAFSSS